MKLFDVCGIGNSIVDILIQVTDDEFAALGLEKGSMNLVSAEEQKELLEKFSDHDPTLISGGSVANSIIAYAQLGGKAALATSLADDRYGLHYLSEFEQLNVGLPNPPHVGLATGTSLILITPDAERTMQTTLACSALLDAEHVSEEVVKSSEWLFVEGYILSCEAGQRAAKKAIELAKECGTKIAFTTSAGFIIEHFREAVDMVVAASDLIFSNEEEAVLLTGAATPIEAATALAKQCDHVVVTNGGEGVHIVKGGDYSHVPAVPCTPVDLTGAGDMFAGSYLFGMLQGMKTEEAAMKACHMAKEVIVHIGPRLQMGQKELWQAAS